MTNVEADRLRAARPRGHGGTAMLAPIVPDRTKGRYCAVLHSSPINSRLKAVTAAIAAKRRATR